MNIIAKIPISKILLILYLVVGFIPSFSAVDRIGPQFVYLSILNLISFIFTVKYDLISHFINEKESLIKSVLVLFTLFGLWGIFSAFYAVNTSEVLIESSRVFIYVIALLNLFLLIKHSNLSIDSIALIISLILLIESVWVLRTFIDLNLKNELVNRNLNLRSFTGNINLTAFTMVLKTPFLIFTLFRKQKLNIIIKMAVLFFVLSTIYILGSRGANLTLIIIFTSLSVASFFSSYFLSKKFTIALLVTFIASIGLNAFQFNEAKGINYLQRTTTFNDQSSNERLRFYSNALESIKENPIMGIGLGNWKSTSIKFEGPDMNSYRVPYHVHNDFLEVTTELGIIGFIFFYGIYIFLALGYFKLFNSQSLKQERLIGLFLILGHLVYLADSFLNFPFTRPVMQIPHLFLITLSISLFRKQNINPVSFDFNFLKNSKFSIYLLLFLGISFSTWVSFKVFNSFVEQRFLILTVSGDYTDYSLKKVSDISSDIPNITALTTPIDALKAALFLRKDSLEVLPLIDNAIKVNPYMAYGELLKSSYYIEKDLIDSAYYYSKLAYNKLPKQLNHYNHYLNMIQFKKDTLALEEIFKDLDETKSSIKYEKYLQVAGKIKQNIGLSEREILNKLSIKNPNSSFNNVFNVLGEIGRENIKNGVLFATLAEKEFLSKNYERAADLFQKALSYNPLEKAYHENAANALTKIDRNQEAIEVLEKMIEDLDPVNGKAEYLLGIIYLDEKQKELGCNYLKIAKRKGFKFPDQIITRFCG